MFFLSKFLLSNIGRYCFAIVFAIMHLKALRPAMRIVAFLAAVALNGYVHAETPVSNAIIVIGAGGTEEYHEDFLRWGNRWRTAFPESTDTTLIGDREGASKDTTTPPAEVRSDRQRIFGLDQPRVKVA